MNQRSYAEEVVAKIEAIKGSSAFTCEQYGALSVDAVRYDPARVAVSYERGSGVPRS